MIKQQNTFSLFLYSLAIIVCVVASWVITKTSQMWTKIILILLLMGHFYIFIRFQLIKRILMHFLMGKNHPYNKFHQLQCNSKIQYDKQNDSNIYKKQASQRSRISYQNIHNFNKNSVDISKTGNQSVSLCDISFQVIKSMSRSMLGSQHNIKSKNKSDGKPKRPGKELSFIIDKNKLNNSFSIRSNSIIEDGFKFKLRDSFESEQLSNLYKQYFKTLLEFKMNSDELKNKYPILKEHLRKVCKELCSQYSEKIVEIENYIDEYFQVGQKSIKNMNQYRVRDNQKNKSFKSDSIVKNMFISALKRNGGFLRESGWILKSRYQYQGKQIIARIIKLSHQLKGIYNRIGCNPLDSNLNSILKQRIQFLNNFTQNANNYPQQFNETDGQILIDIFIGYINGLKIDTELQLSRKGGTSWKIQCQLGYDYGQPHYNLIHINQKQELLKVVSCEPGIYNYLSIILLYLQSISQHEKLFFCYKLKMIINNIICNDE